MTVNSENNKTTYNGDGSTYIFSTGFTFADNDEVSVSLVVTATGATTPWVEGTHYSLTGAGSGSNGTLTVIRTPSDYTPAAGRKLVIDLAPDFLQETALPRGGSLSPKDTLEPMFDKLTRQLLRLKDLVDRAIKVPGSETSVDELPIASLRANKALVFDSNGDLTVSEDDYDDQAADAAASALAAAGSAASAATSATTATTQATTATTQATNASTSATAAAASAAAAAAAVGGVKVSSDDTTPGDLETKLLAAGLAALTTQNGGGNETRTVTVAVASQAEAEAGALNTVAMTPLRVAQAISALVSTADQVARDVGMQNAWNILELQGATVMGLRNMVVDAFETSDGIDATNSTNETYDSTNDLYHNPQTYTADLCTGGTALSGGDDGTYPASNAFDDDASEDTNGQWRSSQSGGSVPSTAYIGYQHSTGRTVRRLTIKQGATGAITSVKVQYSDNGSAWSDVSTHALVADGTTQTIDIAASGSHVYWRLLANATPGGGNRWWVTEVEMMEYVAAPNMVLRSDAIVAASAPTSARFAAEIDVQDSPTIGTHVRLYVSRDNATTFTEVSSYETQVVAGTIRIIRGTATLSGQPSGTNVVLKLETSSNKYVPVHEWGVQCDVLLTPPT